VPTSFAPFERLRIRLPRDYYVRVFGNDHSVDPVAIGRMVDYGQREKRRDRR